MKNWPKVKETEHVPLSTVLPITEAKGEIVITVSKGQAWDGFLQGAFLADAIVLVLNREEIPLYAFRRAGSGATRKGN